MTTPPTIISAEKSDTFIKFDPENLSVEVDKTAHTKAVNVSGMFIPIKYKTDKLITTFKMQTPEVIGHLTDCDENNSGLQYKVSLKLNSTKPDSSFLEEDLVLQKETVEILQEFEKKCVKEIKDKKSLFIEKLNEKKKQSKVTQSAWDNMLTTFEAARVYSKENDGQPTEVSHYLNPKVCNTKRCATTFSRNGTPISYEEATKTYLNKYFYCIALFSLDSLFFQASSTRLFVQARLIALIITRDCSFETEKIIVPDRLKIANTENKDDDDTDREADVEND
jgi:hypothetical protein